MSKITTYTNFFIISRDTSEFNLFSVVSLKIEHENPKLVVSLVLVGNSWRGLKIAGCLARGAPFVVHISIGADRCRPRQGRRPMKRKLPESERTRNALRDLIEYHLAPEDARGELIRPATRLIAEEVTEAELSK